MSTTSKAEDNADRIAKVYRTAYTKLNDARLLLYANNVINLMEGNEKYVNFADLVKQLRTTRDLYSNLLNAVSSGGSHNQIVEKNEAKGAVVDSLNAFELTLNAAANGVPSYITSAGFDCWKKRQVTELTNPPQPMNISIKVDPDTRGCAIVKCKCPSNSGIGSILPSVKIGDGDYIYLKSLSRTGGKIEGLPSGQEIAVRLESVGRRGLQSEPTIPMVIMVV